MPRGSELFNRALSTLRAAERALLAASSQMSGPEHKYVGPLMHDRLIGALETCCRKGAVLRVQNRHVDWEHHQIATQGDKANRCLPQPLD
jgi:hypothetical protein